jgi:hypothetical protein
MGKLDEFMERRRRHTMALYAKRKALGLPRRNYGKSVAMRKQRLLKGARARARLRGLPYAIGVNDLAWPTVCPILGTELIYGDRPEEGISPEHAPSLDRLIPGLGYVPGNVVVISHRANTIKSFGTAAEHEAVARWLRTIETFGVDLVTASG